MYLGFWKRVLINGIFFIAIAGLYSSGLHVANVWVAFMAAFVLGLLNTFVKPFLIILSLPITLWTMGLFYFVINALLLELTFRSLAITKQGVFGAHNFSATSCKSFLVN